MTVLQTIIFAIVQRINKCDTRIQGYRCLRNWRYCHFGVSGLGIGERHGSTKEVSRSGGYLCNAEIAGLLSEARNRSVILICPPSTTPTFKGKFVKLADHYRLFPHCKLWLFINHLSNGGMESEICKYNRLPCTNTNNNSFRIYYPAFMACEYVSVDALY